MSHVNKTLFAILAAGLLVGCSAHRGASPQAATRRALTAQQRADAAILAAEAAIHDADLAAQQTAGVAVPGTPQITDAEQYRRTAASLRSQAISYADLAAKSRSIAASVDDPAEQQHWRDTAADCAARSKALYKLSDHHAKLARKASR